LKGANWVLAYLIYALIADGIFILSHIFKLELPAFFNIYLSFLTEIVLLNSMYFSWSKNYLIIFWTFINISYLLYSSLAQNEPNISLTLGGCLIMELLTSIFLLITNKTWLFKWQFFIILGFIFYQSTAIFAFGFVSYLLLHNLILAQFLQGFSNIGLYSIITLGLIQCKKQLSVQ
jgi:hypothetical protein